MLSPSHRPPLMTFSGLPDRLAAFDPSRARLRIDPSFSFWNSNGLLSSTARSMHRKLSYARSLLRNTSVLIVVETHCSVLEFVTRFKDLARDFVIDGSDAVPGSDGRLVGGVLCFVSRGFARGYECKSILNARIVRVDIDLTADSGRRTIIWGVHNYGVRSLSLAAKSAIKSAALADISCARANPFVVSTSFFGDWNFVEEGDMQLYSQTPLTPAQHRSNEEIVLWRDVLSRTTLVHSSTPTHFWSDRFNCLDRAYVVLDAWHRSQLLISTVVVGDPQKLRKSRISDHSAIQIVFHLRKSVPFLERPIPKFIATHPMFLEKHDKYYHFFKIESIWCPWERLDAHKTIIREAAFVTRDFIFSTASDASFASQIGWRFGRRDFFLSGVSALAGV